MKTHAQKMYPSGRPVLCTWSLQQRHTTAAQMKGPVRAGGSARRAQHGHNVPLLQTYAWQTACRTTTRNGQAVRFGMSAERQNRHLTSAVRSIGDNGMARVTYQSTTAGDRCAGTATPKLVGGYRIRSQEIRCTQYGWREGCVARAGTANSPSFFSPFFGYSETLHSSILAVKALF